MVHLAMSSTEEKDKYQRLLRELKDFVFYNVDSDGNLTYLSPSIKNILGYTPEEFLAHYIKYMTDHPENEKAIYHSELGLKGIRQPRFLTQYFHKDGKRVWFEVSEFPVFDEQGNVVSVEGIAYDVTDRIELEEQLTQAKEEAERANKAKSQFLARMSHELRTPLNAIIGFSQVMVRNKAEPITESQGSDIQNIIISGKHLLKLINEVLDLSHIESGTLDLSMEPVNICCLIKEVFDLIEPLSRQSGVTVTNEFNECDDLYILADQFRLKQVLLNLVSNAIKYTLESGSIALSFEEQGDGEICIRVTDTGLGIPKEMQASLFQPFFRLHEEEIQREGTGIGLAISKDLIELMNGRIGYTSQAGRGSCFYIELPLCDPPTVLQEDKITIVERVPEEKGEGRRFTLLYIEDNSMNLTMVRKTLRERPDIKFLSAPNAKLGLDLARSHRPDLILMDIDLPGMDGITATEYLQNKEETRKIPVIAVSANAMPKDIDKAMKAGFKEYITKPIDLGHFLKTIDQYLH